jgi:hypothetical protein
MHKTIYFFKTVVILVVLFLAKAHILLQQLYGVDFTKGRWLLNQLDCPGTNIQLNEEAIVFFKKFK